MAEWFHCPHRNCNTAASTAAVLRDHHADVHNDHDNRCSLCGYRCEWPAHRGTTAMCGHAAKVKMTAPGGKWWRWCCGTHANRAKNIGWTQAGTDPAEGVHSTP